jgi:alpha-soluble NSF attachment protein
MYEQAAQLYETDA